MAKLFSNTPQRLKLIQLVHPQSLGIVGLKSRTVMRLLQAVESGSGCRAVPEASDVRAVGMPARSMGEKSCNALGQGWHPAYPRSTAVKLLADPYINRVNSQDI